MSATEVTTPKKHVKPSLENCKVCGITTQINARAVISNPAGKTNLGKIFKRTAVSMWATACITSASANVPWCDIYKLKKIP